MSSTVPKTAWLLCLLLPLALVLGCGDDDDDPTEPPPPAAEETIGVAGGTIELEGEATLDVPAGALDADVTFTMADAGDDHADMVATRALGSPVFAIGPSGTTFDPPAVLTLHYDEEDLDGIDESSIIIYTDDGSGWVPLPTVVDEDADTATAQVTHLSDFGVTGPAGDDADGVFTVLEVVRLVINVPGSPENMHTDMIVARFDGVVNVCSPVKPMHPDSVWCNEFGMSWEEDARCYIDENDLVFDFLDLGADYTFHVEASAEVPALEETITMVEREPVITNLQMEDPVSSEGFTVEWSDTAPDSVTITLVLSSESVVVRRTPNDGSFTFTGDDLADLELGTYFLSLSYYNKRFLTDTPGYDPRSHIIAMTNCGVLVHLVDGSGTIGVDGGTVLLGEDGRLLIPPYALDEPVEFTAEVNTSPAGGLEDYTLLTPVYTVGPAGTMFDDDATVEFSYDEDDLAGADEDDIVILTNAGSGWVELTSYVDESNDLVEADVDHLSDFVAAVPTPVQTGGVYAVLETSMNFVQIGENDVTRADAIFMRFDATVAEDPVDPLLAGRVTFGEWLLVRDDDSYEFTDPMDLDFLELGATYDLGVIVSDDVPGADIEVTVPDGEVYVTNLDVFEVVPLNGFTVEWAGSELGGDVEIIVVVPSMGGVDVVVPNNGSYTFTAGDFAEGAAGYGSVTITWEQEAPLVADGYDSHSVHRHMHVNANSVMFADLP